MTAIKKTLLEIVQDILSDTDGDEVNSLSDSLEAGQCATIIEHTFYDIINNRDMPEHNELIKFTSLSDSATPTHFIYPTNVKHVTKLWYDHTDATTGVGEYKEVVWMSCEDFLARVDSVTDDYDAVLDMSGGTILRIKNNKHPEFYTSFDDYHIVMDSYHSTYDATLQTTKTRAMGTKYPIFDRSDDDYTPDIDNNMFPYLVSEARSRFMEWYKGGTTPKTEQITRRQKVLMQGNRYKTVQGNTRNNYGR